MRRASSSGWTHPPLRISIAAMRRRHDAKPERPRNRLMSVVLGEVRPRLDKYVVRYWIADDWPMKEIVCDTKEAARRAQEILRIGDLMELEAHWRYADIEGPGSSVAAPYAILCRR